MCRLDENTLKAADKLKAVLYGAGSIRGVVSGEFWRRGISISSAASANAIPVAEFTFAQIMLSLKRFFFHSRNYKENKEFKQYEFAGGYKSAVGIISYGEIAKRVCRLLKNTEVEIYVWSPELDAASAAENGLKYASLERVFAACDVVSLHTPWLPQTEGMIRGEHFLSMKQNASFINTARGAVINEREMIAALTERPDITALLDVTHPEPPEKDSALYTLPNVVITPHIAGACYKEKSRLGQIMVDELKRFLNGEPLKYVVTEEASKFLA
jgi:phosphoglycerate dehydrogenase-like enzyme